MGVWKRSLYRVINEIALSKEFLLEETIVVTGSPRTGTTWLMQLLGTVPDYITIFEPFHKIWFPEASKLDYFSRKYLPKNSKSSEFSEYLGKVFTGKIRSRKPRFDPNYDSIIDRLKGKKLVVKFVSANRLIPWMATRFLLKKILVIRRAPHSTIASQIKTGFNGLIHDIDPLLLKKEIINEMDGIEELDPEIIQELSKIENTEGMLAAIWAVDDLIVKDYQHERILHVNYEKLLTDGETQLKKILGELNKLNSFSRVSRMLEKPSLVTRKSGQNGVNDPEKQLNKWKKQLSKEQIKNIDAILNIF